MVDLGQSQVYLTLDTILLNTTQCCLLIVVPKLMIFKFSKVDVIISIQQIRNLCLEEG